jgi:aspartate aminotransferase
MQLADRTKAFDSSGIRKVFDLAAKMKDPINLSIGQPDFDVPDEVKAACVEAIQSGKNAYALTQGMPVLREKLQSRVDQEYGHADRKVFVSSGTSGGLSLALWSLVNPGDEVIVFDPYFVMYTAADAACRRRTGDHRHVSGFSDRSEQSRGGDHAADEADPPE